MPGEILEHQAHAGHAAILLADRGVLLAGGMLSDVLIPLLDARRPGQVRADETALDRLGEAARRGWDRVRTGSLAPPLQPGAGAAVRREVGAPGGLAAGVG